jgi:protein phosphatase
MAELPTINLLLYAQTDVGMVRSGNEDNFLILDLSTGRNWTASEEEPKELLTYPQGYYGSLLAVSDGMGGALAGEVASRLAVETVRDRMLQLQAHSHYGKMPFSERLRLAIEEANLLIHGDGQTNPAHKGLGATFTAVALQGRELFFAQVGDSRAYLIRNGKIYRITKDQSLVQQLIDAGQITEEEAETHSYRNVILQALGAHSNVNVEVQKLGLCHHDILILCSDGLSGKIHQSEIAGVVAEAENFQAACQNLIDLANQRGGEDNITVVIAQFSYNGPNKPENEPVEPISVPRSPDTPTEINWSLGQSTDSLTTNPEGLPEPAPPNKETIETKETEPLPDPPSQSHPFTSKLPPRNTSELSRTNDLSDRRGPITAVFSAEEIESETAPKAPAAETDPVQNPTSPLQPRHTEPLSMNKRFSDDKGGSASGKKSSFQNKLFLLLGLLALSLVGLVVGATSYFKQRAQAAQEHARELEQQEKQKLKEGRIVGLREKIEEINKRLQAADKPKSKEKLSTWHEALQKLTTRLEEINQMPQDQLPQISKACDEINNELLKIEAEVNNLQGLLPTPLSSRHPIKI